MLKKVTKAVPLCFKTVEVLVDTFAGAGVNVCSKRCVNVCSKRCEELVVLPTQALLLTLVSGFPCNNYKS